MRFAGIASGVAVAAVTLSLTPANARWLTPDPLFLEHPENCIESPVECNPYVFSRNDPVNFVDPTGLAAAPPDSAFSQRWSAGMEAVRAAQLQMRQSLQGLKGSLGSAATSLRIGDYHAARFFAGQAGEQALRWTRAAVSKVFSRPAWELTAVGGVVGAAPRAALPAARQVKAAWGASKYRHGGVMNGLEHIMYRHSASSGFKNVSRFAPGTKGSDIKGYVDQALRYGKVTPNGANAFTIEHNLGRTIGTNVAGDASSAVRVHVRDGVIQTAFPY
jgi:hypothetical protein